MDSADDGRRFLPVELLAALDMHGVDGRPLRRRLVLGEFIVAVVLGGAAGAFIVLGSSSSGAIVLGFAILGVGANYLPLALYGLRFADPVRLERELDGLNLQTELRRYSLRQLALVVPYLVAAMALKQRLTGSRPAS